MKGRLSDWACKTLTVMLVRFKYSRDKAPDFRISDEVIAVVTAEERRSYCGG